MALNNLFQYACYLVVRVPRTDCPDDGILQIDVPWAREEAVFTVLFESFTMTLVREMPVNKVADHAWHLFHIILKDNAPVSRNRLIELMSERGIGTSVHFKPFYRMTYYMNQYGLRPEDYPNAERIWKGCVTLPIYPSLTDEDLDYICSNIVEILK